MWNWRAWSWLVTIGKLLANQINTTFHHLDQVCHHHSHCSLLKVMWLPSTLAIACHHPCLHLSIDSPCYFSNLACDADDETRLDGSAGITAQDTATQADQNAATGTFSTTNPATNSEVEALGFLPGKDGSPLSLLTGNSGTMLIMLWRWMLCQNVHTTAGGRGLEEEENIYKQ